MKEITETILPKFPVGSTVLLVDTRRVYTIYKAMAEFIGLGGFVYNRDPQRDVICTVIGSGIHAYESCEVVGIEQQDGKQFLVDAAGLRLVEAPTVVTVSLADQVAKLEKDLKEITAERDTLQDKLNAILEIVRGAEE